MNFAKLLRSVIPEKDFVGRYGGDEFIAVIYHTSANYAQTECQFRYCGTAIPFLTVRSTAR